MSTIVLTVPVACTVTVSPFTTIGAPGVEAFTVVFVVLSPLIGSHSSADACVPILAKSVTMPTPRVGLQNAEARPSAHINAMMGVKESFIFRLSARSSTRSSARSLQHTQHPHHRGEITCWSRTGKDHVHLVYGS